MKNQLVLQDIILNYVRRERLEVKVVLSNGDDLNGIIHGFDSNTIILTKDESQYLLYKANVIAVISPVQVLQDKNI